MGNARIASMQPTSIIINIILKIFACLLLASSFQQTAAEDMKDLCWCINPWIGTAREWMGDPLKTCPDWCYVSCDSDCRDIKDAKGKDRCWSRVACNMDIPPRNQIEIKF